MRNVLSVARKELAAFFASPVAFVFLGAFLAVSLFVFFWVERFFARNIADLRPLFEWMPVLLIFLVAALTMRAWSEERRAGTLEVLLTLPVTPLALVLGKFLAVLGLTAVALALTLPLPITVALLGPLDPGPVIGAYLATLFLASAYAAIGLWVSARTDNAIVALIGTAVVCGIFYLLGSEALTSLFGHRAGEVLSLIGAGSRFESITRGVIDLRDLYYYVSITGVFLALNLYTLERLRWATDRAERGHHRRWGWVVGLAAANLLAGNLWLQQVGWARADITEGKLYSISDATRAVLARLEEPLLIRGYFSAQTHPLLAPLVPQLRDLLEEYQIAGGGKVRVEVVDPQQDPEAEREAGEKYGIRPVAFQTASKYQAAVVNSYFDILVQYGDEYETLGFRDLIEVKVAGESDLDVRLRNPEYDITRTIKKALQAYRGGADPLAGLSEPVTFRGFISAAADLPEPLPQLGEDLESVLADLKSKAGDKLRVDIRDPRAGDGALADTIAEQYGFQPLALDLLDTRGFYFYMVLESGDRSVPLPLPESLDRAGLERTLEAGLKRFAGGYLRTVALYTPPSPMGGRFGMGGGQRYTWLRDKLEENATVEDTDLKDGRVPADADLLLVVDPADFDAKQRFAVDQFLMQGGSVILALSPFHVDLSGGAIRVSERQTGLEEWLEHMGVKVRQSMVLDPQNTPFPIPVQRQVGGFVVQEVRSMPYPYFPDLRQDGIDSESGIAAGLGQVTLTWASPLVLDAEAQEGRRVVRLLRSSPDSWTTEDPQVQPDFDRYPRSGFPQGEEGGRQLLAAVLEGRFESFFAGRPSPLLEEGEEQAPAESTEGEDAAAGDSAEEGPPSISGVIDRSPSSARLVVFGSASFLTDSALDLAAEATGTRYLKPVELVENAVDWSLEDRGLLALRGRAQYSRLLAPLDREAQVFWEYLNYALALAGLGLVWWLHRRRRAARRRHYAALLSTKEA